jgi:thermostable 8-oxoguanine DNA glycosylase
MKFQWIITDDDTKLLIDFVNKHKENNFVKSRIRRNLSDNYPQFSKEEFWKWMVACLLTTQQRSGPNSKISKFLITNPFPLNYNSCKESENLQNDTYEILTKFGGIRRTNRISEEIKYNFNWLEIGGWTKVIEISDKLTDARKNRPNLENIKIERTACLLVQNLKGIGPKQSRNLWQALGLTRYEIPIDSRIIKWLNKNGFPFTLSASGLSDENYYQLLMDGIQERCLKSDIFPCVLDGAIFSSYDEEWSEDYELW